MTGNAGKRQCVRLSDPRPFYPSYCLEFEQQAREGSDGIAVVGPKSHRGSGGHNTNPQTLAIANAVNRS